MDPAAASGFGAAVDVANAPSTSGEADVRAPKFLWSSAASLTEMANAQAKKADEAEASAHATFDTVQAKLGRLLNERKLNLEELMKEWWASP